VTLSRPDPDCPTCGGTGEIRADAPVIGSPSARRASMYLVCPTCLPPSAPRHASTSLISAPPSANTNKPAEAPYGVVARQPVGGLGSGELTFAEALSAAGGGIV